MIKLIVDEMDFMTAATEKRMSLASRMQIGVDFIALKSIPNAFPCLVGFTEQRDEHGQIEIAPVICYKQMAKLLVYPTTKRPERLLKYAFILSSYPNLTSDVLKAAVLNHRNTYSNKPPIVNEDRVSFVEVTGIMKTVRFNNFLCLFKDMRKIEDGSDAIGLFVISRHRAADLVYYEKNRDYRG